jgi:hypothetical protein
MLQINKNACFQLIHGNNVRVWKWQSICTYTWEEPTSIIKKLTIYTQLTMVCCHTFCSHAVKWLRQLTTQCPAEHCLLVLTEHLIDGVMVSVLTSSVVDHKVRALVGSNQNYWIGIYCFSTEDAALRSDSKDCWSRNQDNVSE